MGGGNKYSKLDMSQAYQQPSLDFTTLIYESKAYTTLNTRKGLYQYHRLSFGVSSAPGIFQRTMENLLQGISHVVVRVVDILRAKINEDYLENLRSVSEKLSNAGIRLRKEKCFFMEPEVIFCGYVINGNGLKPVASRERGRLK